MMLMKVTGQGLCWIAVLTALLWSCILAERLTLAHARASAYRTLEQIHELQLKQHMIPAAVPDFRPRTARPAAG